MQILYDNTVLLPHGMLFIYDRDAKGIIIPEYDPAETVSFSANAISLAAKSDLDGEVHLKLGLGGDQEPEELENILEHHIESPSGRLSVCVMGDVEICSAMTLSRYSVVRIYTGPGRFSSEIFVVIKSKL